MADPVTQAHRRAQLALRAATLRDLLRLWPMFDLNRIAATWPAFEDATALLIRERGRVSAGLSSAFFREARRAAGIAGDPPALRVESLMEQILAGLRVMGPVNAGQQLALGRLVEDVRKTTLVNVSGVATKFVLDHGRAALLNAVKDDHRSRGWSRAAGATACQFCLMLAGRGTVYKADTASFPSHRHCVCTAVPAW